MAEKTIHTLVLDTGPLIKNEPAVSTLIAGATTLLTHPAVIGEVRDAATRARLETTLKPFLSLREPRQESVKLIQDFARRSGDLQSLSRPDILLLALTYEVECERNGGDWRLRRTPGQKTLNGKPPPKAEAEAESQTSDKTAEASSEETQPVVDPVPVTAQAEKGPEDTPSPQASEEQSHDSVSSITKRLSKATVNEPSSSQSDLTPEPTQETEEEGEEDDGEEDGWITHSNLSKHQARDHGAIPAVKEGKQQVLQSALLTSDFAMQNVALLMNLNLVSPALSRISNLRLTTQRCHACFFVIRPSAAANSAPKQFCPRCGMPTLTRVSCSTSSADGSFKVHLKKNMQWNNRGNRYSVPKPGTASAAGRVIAGGGKGGWGNSLLLAEDQKEYVRAVKDQERAQRAEQNYDPMSEDALPAILSGGKGREGGRTGGRVAVGAGRNVNSRKRN